ncbi:1231_t:CDS:2, partial [Entrophospora sp. SA101]
GASAVPLVPLLPEHCIIGKCGGLYIYLEIQSNNDEYHGNMKLTQSAEQNLYLARDWLK